MTPTRPSEAEKFKRKIASIKLNALLDVTKAINENLSTERLIELYHNTLVEQLKIGKIALFMSERGNWRCVMSHGIKNQKLVTIDVKTDLLTYHEITGISGLISPVSEAISDFDIIIPVSHKKQPLAFLLIGDFDEEKVEMSPSVKHTPFVQTLTNIIIVAVENKRLARENLLQVASRKELELASEMQAMLFPSRLPDDDKLSISAFYQPHHQVGGDYYEFMKLNENEVAFGVADVSGKGVSAALLMANFQANLRALFKSNAPLRETIQELNTLVFANAKGEKFITLFIAKYNLVTRILTYVNEGHNPPLLINGNSIFPLTTGGIGLGMLPEIPRIREGVINVQPNSTLFCYTDGLVEQHNEEGDDYGENRLIDLLGRSQMLATNEINNKVMRSLDVFRRDIPYVDDIALLSCRIY